ncbi:MAG: hypothetical protein M3R27_08515, partial [Bacteroidota bacterium]|nr:hypothetical protein [Bacteroidota bacterium]
MKQVSHSSWAILFVMVFFAVTFCISGLHQQNRLKIDATSYYMYLPAVFLHNDLELKYIDQDPAFYKELTWYNTLPGGERIIKHPMGMSVMLMPFFFIGHVVAYLGNFRCDGYSLPYQNAMSIGVLLYFLAGLHFLRKLLLNYFSETVVAVTLLLVVLGTNLFWYLTYEAFMSHGISFSLICICVYFFDKWILHGVRNDLIRFSVLFGLLLLIRPVLILLMIYFVITGIGSLGGWRRTALFIKPRIFSVLTASGIIFLVCLPQLLYFKYITGEWFFDFYREDRFYFTQSEWLPFLAGFQKGWLVYTPLMGFAIAGLVPLYKQKREMFYAILATLLSCVYVFSSWWWWSYGYCFGMRVMIDFYGVFSIPLACFISFLFSNRKRIIISCLISTFLVALNLFQTWQFSQGLIHFDCNTKESYFHGFFQTKATTAWYDLLKSYDLGRRKLGLGQIIYS